MADVPTLHVYVFKEGLLSRLGHDLRLTVKRFEITLERGSLIGRFDTESLGVDGAIRKGELDTRSLSPKDKQKIEATVRERILRTTKFPEAVLEASVDHRGDTAELRATLTLLGRRRALDTVQVLPRGERLAGKVAFAPSRWGIEPYRGLGGALKVRDYVEAELSIPADLDIRSTESHRWTVP